MMGLDQSLELTEDEKKELSIGLLREWWITATQALVDNAGSETALTYLKPHFIHAGRASVDLFSSLTGIAGPKNIKNAQGIIGAIMFDGIWGPGYIADDGSFIGEVFDCATEGSCKEACIAQCSYDACSVEELDPSYEMSLIHSLSWGDKSCQWLVGKKGKMPQVKPTKEFLTPPHMMVKPEFLPTEEMKKFLAHAYLGELWVMTTKAFIEQAGSEMALERLRFYMRHSGMSLGIRLADRLNAHQSKLESVMNLVSLIQDLHQRESKLTREECSNECEILQCPFSGSPPEICLQYEAFFNGICEAIDPCYEFKYDRMMTKGDMTCHWTIGRGGAEAKSKVETSSGDPAKTLAMRFSKGEITLEEFENGFASLRRHGTVPDNRM